MVWSPSLNSKAKDQEDFPGGSDNKASVYNEGDLGSVPGLRRSAGEETDIFSPISNEMFLICLLDVFSLHCSHIMLIY